MPRQFLRQHLPDVDKVLARRELRPLGRLLDDPYLLHLNRRSVAGGVACGLFVAFIPLPGQMLMAAMLAILLRANLVISVALVWITNPITMPPFFYLSYMVGTWVIGSPVTIHAGFEPTVQWFWAQFARIWKPLMVGSLTIGSLLALAGYGSVHLLWRLHIVYQLRRRRKRRASRSRPLIGNHQSKGTRSGL